MLELETILILICEALETSPKMVKSKSLKGVLREARSLFVYFGHKEGYSFREIGKMLISKQPHLLGYHVRRVNDLLETDQTMKECHALCLAKIESYKNRHLNHGN